MGMELDHENRIGPWDTMGQQWDVMRKWYIRGTHNQQHNLSPIYSHFDDGNQLQALQKCAVTPSRNQTKPYVWQFFTQKGRTQMPDCVKNG